MDIEENNETIEKSGSSADLTSFDELEAAGLGSTPKPESKEISKPKKEESGSKDSKHSKDDKKPEPIKPLRVKYQDKDLEYYPDLKFPVKVNGKQEEVELQKLLNEYSGATNWGRKYTEFDKERRQFILDKDSFSNRLKDVTTHLKTDPMLGLEQLAELAGEQGSEFVKGLKESLSKKYSEYAALPEEERVRRTIEEENQYLKRKLELKDTTQKRQAEMDKAIAELNEFKTNANLDDDAVKSLYNELTELKKAEGTLDKDLITIEFLKGYYDAKQKVSKIQEMVGETNLELVPHIIELMSTDAYKNMSMEDMHAIVKEVIGQSIPKQVKQKLMKSEPTGVLQKNKSAEKEVLFFDDI